AGAPRARGGSGRGARHARPAGAEKTAGLAPGSGNGSARRTTSPLLRAHPFGPARAERGARSRRQPVARPQGAAARDRMSNITPPRWAETIFRFLLAPHDRETVSGDLLEEYRESVYPARGRCRADAWYVRQVAGFAWRENRSWAGLFSAAFIART